MTAQPKAGRNRALRVAFAMLVAVMFSFYLLGGLMAKYVVSDSGSDGSRVAGFAFNLADGTGSRVVDLAQITKPDDTQVFSFQVANTGEVSRKYWLEIELDGSMPVSLTLQKGGAPVLSTTVAELNASFSQPDGPSRNPGSLVKLTPEYEVAPSVEGVVEGFTITATWPPSEAVGGVTTDYDNVDYALNSVAELKITAIAVQVD